MRDSMLRERILEALEAALRRDGRAPSYREIGKAVGVSAVSNVKFHLDALVEEGRLVRSGVGARALRPARPVGIRVEGRIAAGQPIEPGTPDETLDIGEHVREPEQYALLVCGDSMVEDRIFDGDYILVRPAETPHDGQIVVATNTFQGSAATVKRFFLERRKRRVRLQPANRAMEPIYVPAAEWERGWRVQGVVTGVYRRVA